MAAFVYVDGDDWAGVFVDGKLVSEGHSIPAWECFTLALENGPITSFENREVDLDWMHDLGFFPTDLKEVKLI